MMAGVLWLALAKYENLAIIENGKNVTVDIIDVPIPCGEGSRISKAHFRFNYLGKTHRKNFGGIHCDEIQADRKLKLRTNDDNSVFVFNDEGEEIKSDIAACAGLAIMFLACAIFGQFKKEKTFIRNQGNYKKQRKPRQPKMGRYGNIIK